MMNRATRILAGVGMVLAGMTAMAETNETVLSPASFAWRQDAGRTALMRGDAVVWQFNHDPEQAMPFFHPVALPGGPALTWLAPTDHPWHYGFWFAWKHLNGVNYWEINPHTGRQDGLTRWSNVRITTNADYSARLELMLNYQPGPEAVPVLSEARTITVSRPGRDGTYHLDWTLVFRAGDEPVVFERTPIAGEPGGQSWGGYSGLTWRFAREFADWQVVNAQGARGSSCHGAKSDGCDFSGSMNGRVMGVAMLDHASNLNAPTPWYVTEDPATPFACLIAAPIFHRGHRLEAGQSFTLRYRTVIHPGRWNAEQLRSAAAAFGRATGSAQP